MNKLKLSIIAIATMVAGNVKAQTFYQCLPCPAGTYAEGGKCTPCPAGTYSQVSGGTSKNVCTACPDYQWSNAGATKCNWIKIKINMSDYENANGGPMKGQTSKWFDMTEFAGDGLLCHVVNFPTDPTPYYGGCGTGNMWVSNEKNRDRLKGNCRKLPCWIYNKGYSYERRIYVNTDGSTTEYWSSSDPWPNGNAGTHRGVVTW